MDWGRPLDHRPTEGSTMTDPTTDPLLDPKLTATTDGVAGETVLPGTPEGPQGGEPREATPYAAENDLADADIDLDEGDFDDGSLEDGTDEVAGEVDQGGDALESDDIASIEGTGE